MKNQFIVFLSILIHFCCTEQLFSQRIYCEGTSLKVNGKPIYMNACNTPWNNWNDFGGNYNSSFWESEFAKFETYGINSSRIWISCDGTVQPIIQADGTVTGVSQKFWNNVDDMLDRAKNHKIYIMATMMSFDHTKNSHGLYLYWRNMLASSDKVQSYIDNYLIPFVLRYKDNPYLYNIDLCNEIEWMNQDVVNGSIPWSQLQRFVAMCSAAIHKSGSKVTVSLGSAAIKWGSNKYEGNKWSNAALQAQFNDSDAFLDIYQIHYYSWINPYFSNPFTKSPSDYSINDRPVLIGEMPGRETLMGFTTTMTDCFENAFKLGYCGHYPWTSNNAGSGDFGSLSTFGTAASTFRTNHQDLVYPLACASPKLGTDVSICGKTSVILNSNLSPLSKTFTWFKDSVEIPNATDSAITALAIGNYKVIVDSAGCIAYDEIKVLGTITVELGSTKEICKSTSVVLDAGNAEIPGATYLWSTNETTQIINTSKIGKYYVTVSVSNCLQGTDYVSVTSYLQKVIPDTLCSAGIATLSVVGKAKYYWYDIETGGTLLATGNTFFPSITETKTFYLYSTEGLGCVRTPVQAVIDNQNIKCTGPVNIIQTIALVKGWNLISMNVHPNDSSIATIFNGKDVQTIKDDNYFWDVNNATSANSLLHLEFAKAYFVKMNTATAITITGKAYPNLNINLPTTKGWSLAGCPFLKSKLLKEYYNSTNTSSIKNFDGFWKPEGLQNSILSLDPGKGYFIYNK